MLTREKKPDIAGVNQAFLGGRLAGIGVAWVVAGRSLNLNFIFHFISALDADPTRQTTL